MASSSSEGRILLVNIKCNECTRWLGRDAAGYRYQEAFATIITIIRIGRLYSNP